MYPKKFWNEFRLLRWPTAIFVGMWFQKQNVTTRYDEIIKIAIEQIPLRPRFLKDMITGDSIPVDIMTGIIECKLVLFDISRTCNGERNANVMYELGLAHTWRNPEEVIVVRDDQEKLPFDIQSTGVVFYSLDDKGKAIKEIKETIMFRLDQIEKIQQSAVRKAAESLSIEAHNLLMSSKGKIFFIKDRSSSENFISIPMLLNLGLVEMLTDIKGFGYHPTPLGRKVIEYYGQPLEADDIEKYKTLNKPYY